MKRFIKIIIFVVFISVFSVSCTTSPRIQSGTIVLKNSQTIPIDNGYIGSEYNGQYLYILDNDNDIYKTSIDPKKIKEIHLTFE